MNSIAFPQMFGVGKTNIVNDRQATLQNLQLLLSSEKGELFCDPYFGDNLKRMIYEKNNIALRDIIIDDICVAVNTFMPQVKIKREDVEIYAEGTYIMCRINGLNSLNASPNVFDISLTEFERVN